MFNRLTKRPANESISELPVIDQNLVGIGGELTVPNLLRAYRSGAFPWTVKPITWWSPDPRAVLEFENFHVSRSFRGFLKSHSFQLTIDQAFDDVIHECARRRRGRPSTWITPEFINGYSELHRQGFAHSVECWWEGELVGGIYGVSIGGYFAGESMFHKMDNASKLALYHLVQILKGAGFTLFDVQMPTLITLRLGATLLPRKTFLERLETATNLPIKFPGERAI